MREPQSRAVAVLLTCLVAVGPISTDLYLPSLPSLVGVFHTDVARVQLTLSVFLLGFALSQLVYGPLSDRFGRRPMLVIGMAIYLAATIACTLATSIEELITARFFQALGGCCGPVLGRAVVRDVYGVERAARMLAYMGAAMALAPALGPVIGGYLLTWFGWKSSFYLLAGFGVACLSGVLAWLPETNTHRNPLATDPATLAQNYATIGSHKSFPGYALCVAFGYGVIFVFISGSSFVLVDVLGVAPQNFGYCFATAVAGYVVGTLSSGRLTLKLGINRMIALGTALAAVAGLAMAALALAGIYTVAAIMVPIVFCFAGVGLNFPNAVAGAIGPFPKMAGAASALMGFIQMSCAAAIGYGVGHLHDGTPVPMAVAMALVGCAGFAAYWFLVRRGIQLR